MSPVLMVIQTVLYDISMTYSLKITDSIYWAYFILLSSLVKYFIYFIFYLYIYDINFLFISSLVKYLTSIFMKLHP